MILARGHRSGSVDRADKAAWFGVPLSSNSDQMQRVFWPWMQNWRKRSNLTRSVLHYCLWWPNRLGRHRQQHHSLLQRDYNISQRRGKKGQNRFRPYSKEAGNQRQNLTSGFQARSVQQVVRHQHQIGIQYAFDYSSKSAKRPLLMRAAGRSTMFVVCAMSPLHD